MQFKNWRIPTLLQSDRGSEGLSEVRPEEDAAGTGLAGGIWPTALLIAGTALLGAAAIGFWNRRTIDCIRTQIGREPESLTAVSKNEEIL